MEDTLKVYRVFAERHYVAVMWVDVKAESAKDASRLAKKYAQKVKPDPRAEATDNHWQASPDEIIEVDYIGTTGDGEPYGMVEVMQNVFKSNSQFDPAIVLRGKDGELCR